MIKEKIQNNYDILDYLLDLYNYYISLSCKNVNKMIKLENDKRYKENSYIKNKKLEGLKQYGRYLDEKTKTINNMIDAIKNNKINEVNIKFM